jgi:hypothetical protein
LARSNKKVVQCLVRFRAPLTSHLRRKEVDDPAKKVISIPSLVR